MNVLLNNKWGCHMHLDFSKFDNFNLQSNPFHINLFNDYAELIYYRTSLDFLEQQLDKAKIKKISKRKKGSSLIPFQLTKDPIKNTVYISIIIGVYSYFEGALRKYCETYNHFNREAISISDFKCRKHGVDKAIEYLKTEASISNIKSKHWIELKGWKKVRNYLVHGGIKQSDISSLNSVVQIDSENNEYSIIVTNQTCIDFINFVELYLFYVASLLDFDLVNLIKTDEISE